MHPSQKNFTKKKSPLENDWKQLLFHQNCMQAIEKNLRRNFQPSTIKQYFFIYHCIYLNNLLVCLPFQINSNRYVINQNPPIKSSDLKATKTGILNHDTWHFSECQYSRRKILSVLKMPLCIFVPIGYHVSYHVQPRLLKTLETQCVKA